MNLAEWASALADVMPHVKAIRRELHRHPELSGRETGTRERLLREIRSMGLEADGFEGCNGLMVTLRNGEGRCVAIRADMDALPIQEPEGLSFRSEHSGVMHACGHDVHMALALGSMRYLSAHRDAWRGTVKWLFEPMEETVGGGRLMVEQGCLDHPVVDAVIGQHVNPRYPAGTFFCKGGYVSGSSTELTLTIRGKSAHGAYPESGVDAILIAAQVITALQSLVSRTISPFDPAVITFGTVEGGQANNVICDEVRLKGTMRTLSDQTKEALKHRMTSLCEHLAEGMGGTAEMVFRPSYGAVYNDETAYALVEECAREVFGQERMVLREAPSLGVESFCYFLKDTPGVYYDIGSGVGTALHTPTFLVDEDALLPGVAMQCACVLRLLSGMPANPRG